MSALAPFDRLVHKLAPRTAIVLGSGLGAACQGFSEQGSIDFREVPGLSAPSVRGHVGRMSVGVWKNVPILLFFGRLHLYEAYPPDLLTEPVRIAADYGTKVLVLTNAAGGIHASLNPGSLMVIRQHRKLMCRNSWRGLASGSQITSPYSRRLMEAIQVREAEEGRELMLGVYAALTGPSYETPAEIRALAACQVDAVGMSTALEAEAAAALGLEVVGISCVTNAAAGLSPTQLTHEEVLANAKLGVGRLGTILGHLVHAI